MINMAVGDENVIDLVKRYFVSQEGETDSLPGIEKVFSALRFQQERRTKAGWRGRARRRTQDNDPRSAHCTRSPYKVERYFTSRKIQVPDSTPPFSLFLLLSQILVSTSEVLLLLNTLRRFFLALPALPAHEVLFALTRSSFLVF